MKLLSLCVVSAFVIGCGKSSPTAPSPPPPAQIAGAWSGTFESTSYATAPIVIDLQQIGTSVTGTWAQTGGTTRAFGNVNGTVDTANFIGIVTFNYSGGPTCSGSFNGTATAATLNWVSPGFTTGSCGLSSPGNPVGVRFVLQRR